MADDRKRPPVERPTLDEGELIVLTEEDASRIAGEACFWLIQHPDVDRDLAHDISTMMYELTTGEWGTLSRDADSESDTST